MKKKLIYALSGMLFSMSMLNSVNSYAVRICDDCKSCVGPYYVCESNIDGFVSDYNSNCGPNSKVSVDVLEGC